MHQRLGEWRNWAFFILIKRKQAINRLMEIGAKFAASFSELEDSVVLVCWSWCVIQIVVCSISLPMISLAQYCLKLRDCHSFMAFSGESSMVNCLTFPNQRTLMGRNPFWFKTSGWPSQQYWPRRTQYIVPSWARDCYAEMCSIFIGLSRKAVWSNQKTWAATQLGEETSAEICLFRNRAIVCREKKSIRGIFLDNSY